VRELSWPAVIPQLLALLALIGIAYVLVGPDPRALMWGAGVYLVYSYGSRLLLARSHRVGIQATAEGRHEEAIRHFRASYEFFTRHSWLDRWRSFFLMSPSAASYREMALVNVAFCQAQLGRGEDARASYERAAAEFPDSPLATAGLKLAERYFKGEDPM